MPQRNYLGLTLCLRHHHPCFRDVGVCAVTSEASVSATPPGLPGHQSFTGVAHQFHRRRDDVLFGASRLEPGSNHSERSGGCTRCPRRCIPEPAEPFARVTMSVLLAGASALSRIAIWL